jgi:lysophospholipase L1-like esterase
MLCEEYGVDYTEITEAYRANGNEMVVADKLHPSKEIYQEWAAALAEKVKSRLVKIIRILASLRVKLRVTCGCKNEEV